MPLPSRLGRINRRVTNPILWPILTRLPGSSFGRIVHVGRRTGRVYRTPVLGFQRGDHIVFALTYGPGTQWVHNVIAEGACDWETRRGTRHLVEPRRFTDSARRSVPTVVGWVLTIIGADDFLEMRISVDAASEGMPSTPDDRPLAAPLGHPGRDRGPRDRRHPVGHRMLIALHDGGRHWWLLLAVVLSGSSPRSSGPGRSGPRSVLWRRWARRSSTR